MAQHRSAFGCNESILNILKNKVTELDHFCLHWGIVIDEMKLSEYLSATSEAKIGFVHLGHYMPEKRKLLPCNHGLVVMFVSLVGSWCFGSKENVKGDLLAKIVIEATVLAEKAGLFVHHITMR